MDRRSWKCLLVGAVVAVALLSAAPQADAHWWGWGGCGGWGWGGGYGCAYAVLLPATALRLSGGGGWSRMGICGWSMRHGCGLVAVRCVAVIATAAAVAVGGSCSGCCGDATARLRVPIAYASPCGGTTPASAGQPPMPADLRRRARRRATGPGEPALPPPAAQDRLRRSTAAPMRAAC